MNARSEAICNVIRQALGDRHLYTNQEIARLVRPLWEGDPFVSNWEFSMDAVGRHLSQMGFIPWRTAKVRGWKTI
jgi:hypothetical protein